MTCSGNCLACGKCTRLPILSRFTEDKAAAEPREGFGAAADIGTTNAVLALVDLRSGKILARHSFANPQRAFGADVISRIAAANNGNLPAMRRAITESIADGVQTLLEARGIRPEQIRDIAVAGNTVMAHLLLGLSCDSLGVAPFKPAHELKPAYHFAEVFGDSAIDCPVRVVPWFSAFAGGDITAGLLHVLREGFRRFLLADLGTNGEMALYDNGRLITASAAAGPAFESGRVDGASGVIAALAKLRRDGYVDGTGLLAKSAPPVFTQKEIRDLQLAKSAVRSGLEILLEAAGLGYDQIEAVYLAGGVGQAMDADSAITIGLLPSALREKARAAGNTALGGAVRLLTAPKSAAADMEKLLAAAEGVNLAEHPRFQGYFMEYIGF